MPSRRKDRKKPKPVSILTPNYIPQDEDYDSDDPYWCDSLEFEMAECEPE